MNSSQAKKLLDRFLDPMVGALGFSCATPLSYTRSLNEATATIGFPFRWDARGFAAFTCGAGVRVEALARWLDGDANDKTPTLGTPIHFLRTDRSYTEWTFACPNDLEALRELVITDLTNLIVPFVEKYSDLGEIVKTVASPKPRDWFNWDINSRLNLLAAARLVEGDRTGAIKILDDGLLERKNALPKQRFEIERLRKRLTAGD